MTEQKRPISDAQVQHYLSLTMANVRKGVEQLDQNESWRVAPGSPMSADDARTDPYHLSHAARSLLSSAIDHLHAIANLIEGARVLHPMAQFTLARGAIETAGTATWMLTPSSRQERVRRRLRLAVKDSMDSYAASEPISAGRNRTRDEQRQRFREIAAHAGVPPQDVFKLPTSTEMVKAADASTGAAFHIHTAWQICSGFAHGRLWPTLSVLERVAVLEDPETGVGLYRVTSDLAHVAWAVGASFDLLKHASGLYQRGATNHVDQLIADGLLGGCLTDRTESRHNGWHGPGS